MTSDVREQKKLPPVTWEGIVKVQRSLWTSHEESPQIRINSRDESVSWTGEANKDIMRWFEEGEAKFYAKAKLRGGIIHIIRKHKEHSW